jgi:hypothetical protein
MSGLCCGIEFILTYQDKMIYAFLPESTAIFEGQQRSVLSPWVPELEDLCNTGRTDPVVSKAWLKAVLAVAIQGLSR